MRGIATSMPCTTAPPIAFRFCPLQPTHAAHHYLDPLSLHLRHHISQSIAILPVRAYCQKGLETSEGLALLSNEQIAYIVFEHDNSKLDTAIFARMCLETLAMGSGCCKRYQAGGSAPLEVVGGAPPNMSPMSVRGRTCRRNNSPPGPPCPNIRLRNPEVPLTYSRDFEAYDES